MEAEGDVAAVVGDVGGAKEVIPDAEGETIVHAVAMLGREVVGVMPDVHLRIVEEVFERTKGESKVGVVEVANDGCDEMDDDEVVDAKSDEGERDVLQGVVDHVFHPVVAEVSGEAHLLDGVMDFVELPKKWNAVEEAMDIPLNKIPHNEEDQKLHPDRHAADLNGNEVFDADRGQDVAEPGHHELGGGVVDDEGEEEKIEEHVKGIEPEVLAKFRLASPPGAEDLEAEKEEGDGDEPIEVVVPTGLADLCDKILPVTGVGVVDNLEGVGEHGRDF